MKEWLFFDGLFDQSGLEITCLSNAIIEAPFRYGFPPLLFSLVQSASCRAPDTIKPVLQDIFKPLNLEWRYALSALTKFVRRVNVRQLL